MNIANIRKKIFNEWTNSTEYDTESYLENGGLNKCTDTIRADIGEKAYYSISDRIVDVACESERAGFANGFRYGVAFMCDALNGGSVYE